MHRRNILTTRTQVRHDASVYIAEDRDGRHNGDEPVVLNYGVEDVAKIVNSPYAHFPDSDADVTDKSIGMYNYQ